MEYLYSFRLNIVRLYKFFILVRQVQMVDICYMGIGIERVLICAIDPQHYLQIARAHVIEGRQGVQTREQDQRPKEE
jgi:hypothetical protein